MKVEIYSGKETKELIEKEFPQNPVYHKIFDAPKKVT